MNTLDCPEHLADFPNLIELAIHLEKVPQVVGLQNASKLQRLAMTEVGLKSARGIEQCSSLTHLDLSHNKLTEMERPVLARLGKLQTLWMNDNAIERMQALEYLPHLTSLWLGSNRITAICDALQSNSQLEELNLAGNLISNFKDIPNLARMRRLATLSFSEPHFGDNPLCSLCNYQTYLLFHMVHLRMFDSVVITDELRQLAEATYMKKKMYYNMRIKTLKRNTSNVIRKAMEARQTKVSQITLNLNVLLRQAKDVERALHERAVEDSDLSADSAQRAVCASGLGGTAAAQVVPRRGGDGDDLLSRKHAVLLEGIEAKIREIEAVEARAAALKQTVCETSQTSICRLMVELETGGNIRLEDGKPSDVWHSSCVDLVSSRFLAADYADYGIGGMRVTRVTRIHNRYLRNRFEARLEELVNTADGSYKRSLEYLFFSEPGELPGELARTMEDGFRDCADYMGPCGHAAVPLSNSVALSDLPRLHGQWEKLSSADRAALRAGDTSSRHAPMLTTQLLITKVFLSRCAQEKPSAAAARKAAASRLAGGLPDDGPPIRREDYNSFASVYRAAGTDPKQRRWFVFEPALVLPEYLVEVEYLPAKRPPEREPSAAQLAELGGGLGSSGVTSDAEAIDLANLTRPLLRFVQQCALASASDPYDETCTAALNLPPQLPQRPKAERIAPEVIAAQGPPGAPREPPGAAGSPGGTGHGGLGMAGEGQLEVLNLHGNSIRKIEGLASLVRLRVLVLCFNEIARIEGLETLRGLERLELGFNLIKRIEGLKGLAQLKTLELNNNLICRLDDVSILSAHVPQLQVLSLRNNAVCEVKNYRPQLVMQLEHLVSLDGICVGDERASALAEADESPAVSITPELIRQHAYSRKRYSYSLRPNSIAEGDKVDALIAAGAAGAAGGVGGGAEGGEGGESSRSGTPGSSGDASERPSTAASELLDATGVGDGGSARGGGGGDDWWRSVEELELNHQHLHKLHGLERLVNLRKASFCNNDLARVEGLERCTQLEELSLEDNRIIRLENLSSLRRLTKLDVGKNKIAHVDGLDSLSQLSQLSLEDNDIASLAPLARLASLMELYIGNNRLASLKEVQQLKELPKLIILDLSGNPLCAEADYRSYTVYQLRKLKVLDGVGIEQTEQMSAKERFAGRLTTEGLVERLGHSFWHHVRELDLSRSKLRELDALHAEGFSNLRELNLDGNLISDVGLLPRLPALSVLRLNNNVVTTPEGVGGSPATARSAAAAASAADASAGGGPRSGLGTMHALEVLQLGFNQINDLPSLRLDCLPALKILHLQGNELMRIEGLSSQQQLRELVLDRNKIKQLEPSSFAALTSLRELRMEECGLRSLLHFGPLPNLQALFLGGNRIAELSEIDRIVHLPSLLELVLLNNPCARKPLYRPTALRKLLVLRVLDGRDVAPDERERADLLLSTDRQVPGAPSVHDSRASGNKVPLKLTSLNFEMMAGLSGGLDGLSIGGSNGGAPHSAGGLSVGGSNGGSNGGSGSNANWHPMASGHDSFFLPAGKQLSGMVRGQASERKGSARVSQWRMLDPHGQR